MKSSILMLVLISALFSSTFAQRGSRSTSTPPHERRTLEGEIKEYNRDKTGVSEKAPTQVLRLQAADLVKLRRDASELARLAQSIPPDVDQTTQGMLPKELNHKLKRIEKLAKQLRLRIPH